MGSDKLYILCEFINEDEVDTTDNEVTRPVRIGYSEWVQFEEGERKSIESLINMKKEVELKWPLNYDVVCKERMSKYTNIQWTTAVAVIIAQEDEWKKIRDCEKTMLAHNKPYLDRNMRKEAAKRELLNKPADRPKSTTNVIASGAKKRKRSSVESVGNQVDKKIIEENDSAVDEESIPEKVHPKVRKVFIKSTKNLPKGMMSKSDCESEGSTSDSDVNTSSGMKKEQINIVKAENHRLRKEVNALRAAKVFAETDFLGLKKEMRGVKSDLKEVRSDMKLLKDECKSVFKDFKEIKDELKSLIKKCENCTGTCSKRKPGAESNKYKSGSSSSNRRDDTEQKSFKGLLHSTSGESKSDPISVSNELVSKSQVGTIDYQGDANTSTANDRELNQGGRSSKTPVQTSTQTAKPALVIDGTADLLSPRSAQPSFKTNLLVDWLTQTGEKKSTSAGTSFSIDISEPSLFKKDVLSEISSESNGNKGDEKSLQPAEKNERDHVKVLLSVENNTVYSDGNLVPVLELQGNRKKKPNKPPKSKTVKKENGQPSRPQPDIPREAVFKFGSAEVTGHALSRCRHSGKASHLAVDLLVILFTKKEMALCNLTGRVPNAHVQRVPKGMLDKTKITALIDYMAEFLKDEMDRATVDEVARLAISNKLSNFIKSAEAKQIIEDEYQRLQLAKANAAAAAPAAAETPAQPQPETAQPQPETAPASPVADE